MKRYWLPLVLLGGAFAAGTARGDTRDGSCLEDWALENFQPASPTFGQVVESSAYHPRTSVVMLLASW